MGFNSAFKGLSLGEKYLTERVLGGLQSFSPFLLVLPGIERVLTLPLYWNTNEVMVYTWTFACYRLSPHSFVVAGHFRLTGKRK